MYHQHDVQIFDVTRGIDNLLNYYQEHRRLLVDAIYSDPDHIPTYLWSHYLFRDDFCTEFNKNGQCLQCRMLKRVNPKCQNSFVAKCGKTVGTRYMIKDFGPITGHIGYNHALTLQSHKYLDQHPEHHACGTPITRNYCVTGDPFVINLLSNWVAADYFQSKGLPSHVTDLIHGYSCKQHGYMLFKSSHRLVDIYNYLTPEIIEGLILQLLVALDVLRDIGFNHGIPSKTSLFVADEPVTYEYKGVKISCPYRLMLGMMRYSSFAVKQIHYSADCANEMLLSKNLISPKILSHHFIGNNMELSGNYFIFEDRNEKIFHALRHSGVVMYPGSFDLYSFLISLMGDCQFRSLAFKSPLVRCMWEAMWLPSDYNKNLNSICGKWLRCDIIDHLWKILASYKNGNVH